MSRPKLKTGRVHDWPLQGICATPVVDGDRMWLVTNRCEVLCLDTEGFLDGENDGEYQSEENENKNEADIVWQYDMMKELAVSPHNMSFCSVTTDGTRLFVNTSNGVGNGHTAIPSPNAPSFIALDRNKPKLLWSDKSPGSNILHGQWSSPSYAVLGGRPQVLFAGGDGWLYSFDPKGNGEGKSKLLWKFDCNPKESKWILGGRGTRNNIVGFPVVYDDLVYIAVGQDPEHGEGMGHLWCIDPTKNGDVSPELVIDVNGRIVPPRRYCAIGVPKQLFYANNVSNTAVQELNQNQLPAALVEEFLENKVTLPLNAKVTKEIPDKLWTVVSKTADGVSRYRLTGFKYRSKSEFRLSVLRNSNDRANANPNSAVVWHLGAKSPEEYKSQDFEAQFHRCTGSPVIKDDLLYIGDFSGLFHCINAKTGNKLWTYDRFAACWGSALVVDDKVYIGDEDGDIAIFRHSADSRVAMKSNSPNDRVPAFTEINMGNSIYTTPIVANNVLLIAIRNTLFAIEPSNP